MPQPCVTDSLKRAVEAASRLSAAEQGHLASLLEQGMAESWKWSGSLEEIMRDLLREPSLQAEFEPSGKQFRRDLPIHVTKFFLAGYRRFDAFNKLAVREAARLWLTEPDNPLLRRRSFRADPSIESLRISRELQALVAIRESQSLWLGVWGPTDKRIRALPASRAGLSMSPRLKEYLDLL